MRIFVVVLLWLWVCLSVWGEPAWVIVYGNNGVKAEGIPPGMADCLNRLVKQRTPIRGVFLAPGGGWGVLHGTNVVEFALTPSMDDLRRALDTAYAGGQLIRQVSVAPDRDAWAILCGENQLVAQRCPDRLIDVYNSKLRNLRIESVALGPQNRFVITYDRSGFDATTDQQTLDQLMEVSKRGERFGYAWMTAETTGFTFGEIGYGAVKAPDRLWAALLACRDANQPFQAVAVRDADMPGVVLNIEPGAVAVSPANPQPASPSSSVQSGTLVSIETGGSVQSGGARADFPAHALTRPLQAQLTILPAPAALANTNRRLLSPGYQLELDQKTFREAITLTLPFERSKLPAGAENRIYGVLVRGSACQRIQPTRVDMQNATVTLQTRTILPEVACDAPNGFRPIYFAVVADVEELKSVLTRADCVIYGAGATKELSQKVAPEIYRAFQKIRDAFRGMGFELDSTIHIFLGKLNGVRGHADDNNLELDVSLWKDDDGSKGTLAHELFHNVQFFHFKKAGARGFLTGPSAESEKDWAAEATAQWMAYRLYPNSSNLRVWLEGLDIQYAYRTLLTFASIMNADTNYPYHQYQSFVFFAYLDQYYQASELLLAMYPKNTPTQPGESVGAFLENFVATNPDRKGRRLKFADLFQDFLVRYAWTKDFAPLSSMGAEGQLGPKGVLKLPRSGPENKPGDENRIDAEGKHPYQFLHVACNLPEGEGEKRVFSHTFRELMVLRESPGRYALLRAHNISSTLSETKHEKGSLKINLKGASFLRLVAFPYRKGMRAPVFGTSRSPVTIPHWEAQDGAIIWVLNPTEEHAGNYELTVSAEVEGEAPPAPAAGPWIIDSLPISQVFAGKPIGSGTLFISGPEGGVVGNAQQQVPVSAFWESLHFKIRGNCHGSRSGGTVEGMIRVEGIVADNSSPVGSTGISAKRKINELWPFTGTYDSRRVFLQVPGHGTLEFQVKHTRDVKKVVPPPPRDQW